MKYIGALSRVDNAESMSTEVEMIFVPEESRSNAAEVPNFSGSTLMQVLSALGASKLRFGKGSIIDLNEQWTSNMGSFSHEESSFEQSQVWTVDMRFCTDVQCLSIDPGNTANKGALPKPPRQQLEQL
jgi:hypothetical protein